MIGQAVAHYQVIDRLGVGGMGEVYRAHDPRLHRDVALKVLPAALAHDPDYMARFAREAQVLAALNHPNIAAVYGLEEGQGVTALVMELVAGDTLAERIQRGALPVEGAAAIALQIAQALEEAHERGIIHRDLKPANIKITPEGRVKVLDFGLAKAIEQGGSPSVVDLTHSPTVNVAATQAGVILGTAGYMSPEQASAQRTDRRADIWAFGIVFLEMLTGKRAFTGETVAHVLAAVLHGSPDLNGLPANVPPRIVELLRRCLARDVKSRLQSIGDARIVLEEYLDDPDAFDEQSILSVPMAPPARRATAILPWAIAALAVLIAAAAAIWGGRAPSEPPVPLTRLRTQVGPKPLFLGAGSSAAVSPDGRRLALSLGTGQSRQLYVRSMDQLDATPLAGTEVGYNPFFSPDGQWIGFLTPTSLKKVSVSGGTPITLCPLNRPRGASWGANDVIVFAPNPTSGLFAVPAAGGTPSVLTTLDATKGEVAHRWPQVLPGGRAVLFISVSSMSFGAPTIEVLELESGKRKVVQPAGGIARYLESGYLVYLSQGTLFAAPFDLDSLELTGTPAPVLQGIAETGGAQYDVSSDGTLVYLEGQTGTPRYELVGVDRTGAFSPLLAERQTYVEPRFSPDGRRLATEIVTGPASDSWVFDLERGTSTRLTFADSADSVPVWSPDGAWIAFGTDREGAPGLYRKRADGSGEEELLFQGNGTEAPCSWSRDGRFLLYVAVASETGNNLWVLPLEGDRTPQPFLVTEFSEAEAAFSPNGRFVAYQAEETGRIEVYVRPFPAGGGKWQVSAGGGTHPRWQADGKRLYFRNDNKVMAVDVDTSGDALGASVPSVQFEGPFTESTINGVIYADYDVSPDGQRFAMLRGDEATRPDHLVVVFGFADELRATFR